MAKFSYTDLAGTGVDMGVNDVVLAKVSARTTTILRFGQGDHTITYSGDFTTSSSLFFGTIDSMTLVDGGETILRVSDLDKDAAAFWNYFQRGDRVDAFNFIVSGNDAIRGTNFADGLLGGGGRDTIHGRGGRDMIDGGARGDNLHGDGGADRLLGAGARDKLNGGAGDDRMDGGRGDDVLLGGAGRDVLVGGAGSDRFVFADKLDFADMARPDVIRDFNRRADDVIDLRDLDANTFKRGEQAFTFIGRDAFSETAGELRFKNGVVSGDVQGDGIADFHIAVDDVPRMSAADFLL